MSRSVTPAACHPGGAWGVLAFLEDWFGKWCREMKGVWDAGWRSRPDSVYGMLCFRLQRQSRKSPLVVSS